ncbi:MAG TPA: radical SAM protein [Candidatus Avacidaminococcus intestinavium]|uniref:Radical SAM protein n=1 Tax=Candidatus Avacidaminococcus intestinavium TaxID=2840684 RepID=A0A9D1MNA2_9FIRM|nr:radical SAM protein [Candidatus Avacidaminococcus intestinavium]
MSWQLKEGIKKKLTQEVGATIYAPGARQAMAFVYPNTYTIGMSNLGLQILYKEINASGFAACERFFLPEKKELALYQKQGLPLLSMETQRPLDCFGIIGVMMSFELDYLNFLQMLMLSKIELLAEQRDTYDPFIIIGGPCATFNPEPLAIFADAFVIGEGEEVVPNILRTIQDGREARLTKREILASLARLAGVYVPAFYEPQYVDDAFCGMKVSSPAPKRVERQWVRKLDQHTASSSIVSAATEFENMFIIEVARGCGRHCRFCMAGYCFRKPRARALDKIIEDIKNRPPSSKKVGLMGAAVSDYPYIKELTAFLVQHKIAFTVASLRADTMDQALADALAASGQQTLTVAPEAGSKRLRSLINKGITEDDIYKAVELAARAGMKNIKLYYMIGLPTETDEDITEMIAMIARIRQKMTGVGNKGELVISTNAFVPKPFTPFQWQPLFNLKILKERFKRLEDAFRKDRTVAIQTESLKETVLQAALARGERFIGEALYRAVTQEHGNLKAAFKSCKIDYEKYATRILDMSQVLPWSHIDIGLSDDYLTREWERAEKLSYTLPCFEHCQRCGVCGGNE